MKIHICTPFSLEKNLGKAYNETMSLIPDGDWACLIDYDVQFLLPSTVRHMYGYVDKHGDTGLYTCFTNRLHPLAKNQLLHGIVQENDGIKWHSIQAIEQEKQLYQDTELNKHISGFLMLISKKTWNHVMFNEDKKCLGVDNDYSDRILEYGYKIRRMDGIYVFHSYRLLNGIRDKSHLQ